MKNPLFFCWLFFMSTILPAQSLIVYPAPEGSPGNEDFTVKLRTPGKPWQDIHVYPVRVDQVIETKHTPQNSSMAYFDFSGTVDVAITWNKGDIRTVKIRPLSYGIQPVIKGNTISFSLTDPRNLSVEVNGDLFHNLQLFAGAVETHRPFPPDAHTLYYGPGIHHIGTVTVPGGTNIYIAGGALVEGRFVVSHVEDVRIFGRGILYQSATTPSNPGRRDGILVEFSKNVDISGIIVLPTSYTLLMGNSQGVTVRNLKSFSAGGNNDGIDVFSSRDVLIDSVFMRNSDDNIAIYGHRWGYYGNVKNVTVSNSILWADVAHPVLIGTHGDPPHPDTLEDMKFVNLDILDHCEAQVNYQGCLSINAGDENLVRNIRFEHIRVEDIRLGQLVNLRVMYNRKYNAAPGRGIENIYFKDLRYDGSRANLSVIAGYDSSRPIRNIVFEDLRLNGKLIWDNMPGKPGWYQTADLAHFFVGEHVEGLKFITSGRPPGAAIDFDAVDQRIQQWVDGGYYPGAGVILAKNGQIIHEKYFGSYTPASVAYIASAGKWLAAATIAAVVDDGRLSWDDKVKKWLPAFTGPKGEATLRQLLSHTSGYPDYQPKGRHPDDYQTLQESVRHIVDLPADTLPGAVFHYGGLAMQVAGRMAELATGEDWETLFQEKIALPLNMRSTHFTPVDTTPGHNPMLGGGARTILRDYLSFLEMIAGDGTFNGKRLLSKEAIREMQADQVRQAWVSPGEYVEKTRGRRTPDIYGLGEWREEVDNNGEVTLISSPGWAGAYPWIDKKNDICGFFLARVNTEKAGKTHFSAFYSSPVLPMLVRQHAAAPFTPDQHIATRYPDQHAASPSVSDQQAPLKGAFKAYSFNLQNVRLLKSRFTENMQREGEWMLSLPVDRLLHSFRVNAGMLTDQKDSKTKMPRPLGGWEQLDMELRGHSIGHLLSGLALQYASTGEEKFRIKADSLVKGLAQVQQVLDQDGYLSAFPQHYIDRNIAGQAVWAPWYTIHKLAAGFIDQYCYAGNTEALAVVRKMADWAYKKLSSLTPEQLAVMLRNEFGGMNEAWYNLYAITGETAHKTLGDLFYHKAVLDPLASGEDHLDKMHANTVIPKVTGEAREYEITGDPKAKRIAEYFWTNIIAKQTYAIGSNSDKEHFIPPGKISEHLSGYTGETCNTYNMLKLTRHLFTWDADVKYADYYEQALYNHIFGQQDPSTGMVCYFTPMKPGAYKLYSTRDSSFWCCVGSGFESHSKYGEAIYYHDEKGIFVNLFIPSVLSWKEKGIQLRQETAYPEEETIRLTIDSAPNQPISLYIRYPVWAANGARITINGKVIAIHATPASYITLNRKWKKGDHITITYPMSLRTIPAPDDPNTAAIAYGPIILAGEAGTKGMRRPDHNPADPYEYYDYDYQVPAGLVHSLHTHGQNISSWLKPAGKPLQFVTVNATDGEAIRMKPYYDLHRERYVVYWNID